jgi:Planctomycete cytochrome C
MIDKIQIPRGDDFSMSLKPVLLSALAVVSIAAAPGRPDRHFDAESVEYFEKKVRPLLVNNCNICHSAETNSKGGLRVDDRNGLIQGGNRGPAVVPGDPENSILIQAVLQSEDDLKMPPKKRLSAEEIAVLTKWVKDGAAWTEVDASVVSGNPNPKYDKLKKEHWAWQPLKETKPPAVRDASWPRSDIDRFVLAKLENSGSRRGQARLDSSSHL